MDIDSAKQAAEKFGNEVQDIQKLSGGLIHFTYKIDFANGSSIVLQNINTNSFQQPKNLIENYHTIYNFLQQNQSDISIPEPLLTFDGNKYDIDELGNFWRATRFRSDCYTKNEIGESSAAKETATAFARFTYALRNLKPEKFLPIIPGFHDLEFRYKQFEDAEKTADSLRLQQTTDLRKELKERNALVTVYKELKSSAECRLRIMHHDCKITNVLFDKENAQPSCIIDLDTTMPGFIFSDAGDMIRTMACNHNEESTEFENIAINKEMYQAIIEGYLEGMGEDITDKEKEILNQSGLLLMYMQALRFLTDYLNNDIYYQIKYPEQNLNRAKNQFYLMRSMEKLLKETIQ